MLYVTTRNNRDTYTVKRVLCENRGPDGGLYVPFHWTQISSDEIAALLELSFEQCTAQILNRLLDLKLTGWDVSFYTGRYPVRIKNLGHRMLIAEAWHNPDWCYERLERNLTSLVSDTGWKEPSDWVRIALRMAVFAGLCSELNRSGCRQNVDIAVVSGDFISPISAWYLRSWGFPIGNIICCCNENGNIWDLIANGQMRTDGISIPTDTPEADVVIPAGLERLIYACGGVEETVRYLDACRQGRTYIPCDALLEKLRSGIYVSVVGNQRMKETIPRVFASRKYLLSPYDALCYCGLSDYRARFSEINPAILFSEKSPVCDEKTVAAALGIQQEAVKNFV